MTEFFIPLFYSNSFNILKNLANWSHNSVEMKSSQMFILKDYCQYYLFCLTIVGYNEMGYIVRGHSYFDKQSKLNCFLYTILAQSSKKKNSRMNRVTKQLPCIIFLLCYFFLSPSPLCQEPCPEKGRPRHRNILVLIIYWN